MRITRILNVNILLVFDLFGLNVPDEILKHLKNYESIEDIVLKIKEILLKCDKKSSNIYDKVILRFKIERK